MEVLKELLAAHGGVVSLRQLSRESPSRAEVRRAVRRAGLRPLRPGWFAAAGAEELAVRAVRLGGAASCATAFARAGAWQPDGAAPLHIRIRDADGAPRPVPTHIAPKPARIPVDAAVDPLPVAALCLPACLPRDEAVAVLDSALQRRLLHPADVVPALRRAGTRGRAVATAIDPSAESGIESLMRLLIRGMGLRFRTQVRIRGVGRVDFLVGDRLVAEVDGFQHADAAGFQQDRERDRELARLGFRCVRFTYADLRRRPDAVRRTLADLVAAGEHVWQPGNCTWRRDGATDPVLGPERSSVSYAWEAATESWLS